jgi:hypothetical protein
MKSHHKSTSNDGTSLENLPRSCVCEEATLEIIFLCILLLEQKHHCQWFNCCLMPTKCCCTNSAVGPKIVLSHD